MYIKHTVENRISDKSARIQQLCTVRYERVTIWVQFLIIEILLHYIEYVYMYVYVRTYFVIYTYIYTVRYEGVAIWVYFLIIEILLHDILNMFICMYMYVQILGYMHIYIYIRGGNLGTIPHN
jgi:hypothetical protein